MTHRVIIARSSILERYICSAVYSVDNDFPLSDDDFELAFEVLKEEVVNHYREGWSVDDDSIAVACIEALEKEYRERYCFSQIHSCIPINSNGDILVTVKEY